MDCSWTHGARRDSAVRDARRAEHLARRVGHDDPRASWLRRHALASVGKRVCAPALLPPGLGLDESTRCGPARIPLILGACGNDHRTRHVPRWAAYIPARRPVGGRAYSRQSGDVLLLARGTLLRAPDPLQRRRIRALATGPGDAEQATPRTLVGNVDPGFAHALLRRVPVRPGGVPPGSTAGGAALAGPCRRGEHRRYRASTACH